MIILASEKNLENPYENLVPRLNQFDDLELIEQCRREIPHRLDAFRELVTRYESSVYETCFRVVADKKAAEQICEDAFLQVFHQIHRFQSGSNQASVKIWIFQIVHRLCELHFEGAPSRRGNQPVDSTDTMAKALQILDRQDRDWIVLRFVSGLTVREIAEILEVTSNEAKEKLYHALCRFREASELIAF